MNATRSQLVAQYNRAKKLLWTEHFREAANAHTPNLFDTADLMAIGSRETNLDPKWLTRKGDNGHGAGLMQIDDRSFPEFTNSTKWKDARLGILYGAKVLREKWDDLQKTAGKSLKFKGNSFTGPRVSGVAAQQIALAAYNSGRAAAYYYAKRNNPDLGTTGKDYSSDVMQRARVFRELLAKDGMLDKPSAAAPAEKQPSVSLVPPTPANPPETDPTDTGRPPGSENAPPPISHTVAETQTASTTGEQTGSQTITTEANVAVEKEADPPGFFEGIKLKMAGWWMAIGGAEGARTYGGDIQAFGIAGSDLFQKIVYVLIGAFLLWLLYHAIVHLWRAIARRWLTTSLVTANSTPTNQVIAVDSEELDKLEAAGWVVVRRK